jgi:RNA polymerase sigma-70 factor (ECF subfamily)
LHRTCPNGCPIHPNRLKLILNLLGPQHAGSSVLPEVPYLLIGDEEAPVALLASLGIVPDSGSENREASPDAALLHRLLQQDVNAFEQLYDRHSRIVYALVLRILRQAPTAEEVVQDVFLQLWRNAASYKMERGAFVPWLLTLARNRALDQLRLKSERQRRREEQAEELPPVVTTPPEYEKELDERRSVERVRALMGGLLPQQKRAIELAYFEGLSHSEIADKLKEPLGTVKSWIRNGLLRLKEGLQTAS